MKKIVFALLLLTVSGIHAQTADDRLFSISQINAYNGRSPILNIIDSVRGGYFARYTGSDPVDNGMIFQDAAGTKWLRQTSSNYINIQWYGVFPYNNYAVDVAPVFTKALNYIYRHKFMFSKLYVPGTIGSNSWYYLKSTVVLQDIELIGDGPEKNPRSLFKVAPNTTAFSLPAYDQSGNTNNNVTVKNIAVSHYDPVTLPDSSHHSFDIRCFVNFDNVFVVNNKQGNGINIIACGGAKDGTNGNADQSNFRMVQAEQCINGFYIYGCDANVISFTNCSAVSNARWGVYDDGLLGNKYYNCHFSNNGKQENTGCTYQGNFWFPVDNANVTGKRPDLFPDLWYKVDPLGGVQPWDAKRKYYSGGTALIKNQNANTLFIGTYTESNQAPAILNQRSTWLYGSNGSRVMGGTFVFNNQGVETFGTINGINAYMMHINERLGVGTGNPKTSIHTYESNTDGAQAIRIENDNALPAATTNYKYLTLGQLGTHGFGVADWANTALIEGTALGGIVISGYQSKIKFQAGDRVTVGNIAATGWKVGNNATAAPSAVLDVESKSQGLLPPRMTTAQRTAINAPAEGLMVYDLTLHKLYVWDGKVWQAAW